MFSTGWGFVGFPAPAFAQKIYPMKNKALRALKGALFVIVLTFFINSYAPPGVTSTQVVYCEVLDTVFVLVPQVKDVRLLGKLIESEARSEDLRGKVLVGEVVRNRMEKTGHDLQRVVFKRGQFDGVYTTSFKGHPSPESLAAAYFSLMGSKLLPDDVYYYHNPKTSTDTSWVRFIEQFKELEHGNHVFCHHPNRRYDTLGNSSKKAREIKRTGPL